MSGDRRKVLVTGGAGYVGAHACKALAQAGFVPVTYDNLSTGRASFVRWGPLVQGDTRDAEGVADTIRSHDAAAVLHFAALSSVGESMTDPVAYYANNVDGLLGVLAGMAKAGVEKLVFSSTAAVYGARGQQPLDETAAADPINPYGRSKLMCEQILADVARAGGLKFVALRYFNASGADPDAEVGEQRAVETHLIPRAMMALQGHIDDFQVFGADFATPDGTAVRDYVHVSDLADAHVLALEALLAGGSSGVFNLGGGRGHSVGEVLDAIRRVTGREMPAATGARRPGDPEILVADTRAAQSVLGFRPRRSDLETIVETAWRWHQVAHPLRSRELSLAGEHR